MFRILSFEKLMFQEFFFFLIFNVLLTCCCFVDSISWVYKKKNVMHDNATQTLFVAMRNDYFWNRTTSVSEREWDRWNSIAEIWPKCSKKKWKKWIDQTCIDILNNSSIIVVFLKKKIRIRNLISRRWFEFSKFIGIFLIIFSLSYFFDTSHAVENKNNCQKAFSFFYKKRRLIIKKNASSWKKMSYLPLFFGNLEHELLCWFFWLFVCRIILYLKFSKLSEFLSWNSLFRHHFFCFCFHFHFFALSQCQTPECLQSKSLIFFCLTCVYIGKSVSSQRFTPTVLSFLGPWG